MATSTMLTISRRTAGAADAANEIEHDQELGLAPGAVTDAGDEDWEVLDFWGSRDSGSCLATWG
jgi:hypothetical protein